jgi:hypothetical protein
MHRLFLLNENIVHIKFNVNYPLKNRKK